MEYKSYQHIEKLGKSEVEGILDGKVYLFYKIDGTNASVWLKNNQTLGFGSRKKELIDSDNAGFKTAIDTQAEYAETKKELLDYLAKHPTHIIYGEWLVKNVLKTYQVNAWRQFYIFDILDTETGEYINYDTYSKEFDSDYPNLKYIPCMVKLNNPIEEDLKYWLLETGKYLINDGLGEGIVIKNYNYKNKYGRHTWAKLLCEEFYLGKSNVRIENSQNKEKLPVEYGIVKMMTDEHILKEKNKIEEKYNENFMAHFGELLESCYREFLLDNLEIIIFKKYKSAIIDFKKLRELGISKIKNLLLGGVNHES